MPHGFVPMEDVYPQTHRSIDRMVGPLRRSL
jgi:hypothetical protein